MFGLDNDNIRNINQAFIKYPQIEKVILYGSRAKGNYRNGSDIDITLVGEQLSLRNTVYPLMDVLEELYLPYTFDISIFSQIDNNDLIEHIHRVGKVFYEKTKYF
ncbi:MAG: nucleotidyltransferase domain-containing protein [Proteobacteria bacterium]|nr:nucleotidyltransferase domain-containing protein [Pseudomonadota bacterium]